MPNPATRWFEWSGSDGVIKYYDKTEKKNISVGDKFAFILLDQLSVVKGWHEPSGSGITSNEVRDMKAERLVVRAFKGGQLAEGFYSSIRDSVMARGGYYTKSLYIAYKPDPKKDELALGNLQLAGAALNGWIDFLGEGNTREEIWKKGIYINGWTEDKKGKIVWRTPKFSIVKITEGSNAQALELNKKLEAYFTEYFKRSRTEQVQSSATPAPAQEPEHAAPTRAAESPAPAHAAASDEPPIENYDAVPF